MEPSFSSGSGPAETSSRGEDPALEATAAGPHEAWCLYGSILSVLVGLGICAFFLNSASGGYGAIQAVLIGVLGLGGSMVFACLLALCSIFRREPGRWLAVTIAIANICLAIALFRFAIGF